jgi:hypothetical protein
VVSIPDEFLLMKRRTKKKETFKWKGWGEILHRTVYGLLVYLRSIAYRRDTIPSPFTTRQPGVFKEYSNKESIFSEPFVLLVFSITLQY